MNHVRQQNNYRLFKNLLGLLQDKKRYLLDFYRMRQFYDEPKFWFYSSTLNSRAIYHDGENFDSTTAGISFFSEEEAVLKCLGESIERFCNFIYRHKTDDYVGPEKKGCLSLSSISRYSGKQLRKSEFAQFRINKASNFRWTKYLSFIDKRTKFIPSQLTYLSYKFLNDEPIIYPSISTGVAGGFTLESAILRGLYEVIERDAYMIHYLNRIPGRHIDISKIANKKILYLINLLKRYKFDVYLLDLSTDVPVPVIGALLIDKTGIGKAVSLGLKAHGDVEQAIIGAINEGVHTRDWIRRENRVNIHMTKSDLIRNYSVLKRGLYWYSKKMIKYVEFWTNSKERSTLNTRESLSNSLVIEKQLNMIKIWLQKHNYDAYWKNITLPEFKEYDYFIVKTIVPQFQPLYLNEAYPILGGDRLSSVPAKIDPEFVSKKKYNPVPHPFL